MSVHVRRRTAVGGSAGRAQRLWVPALVLILLPLGGCGRKPSAAKPVAPPVPVRVAPVVQKTMPVEIATFGYVEAISTVSVKCQVTGELTTVSFQEGEFVRRGQELFMVDRRPFEAAVRQAEAVLLRDRALLENATLEARRAETLSRQGAMTQEQADNARTAAAAQAALVKADEAALENARLQLGYCIICAPMDGCAGRLLTQAGNILKANETAVVTLTQIEPIYVAFSIPETQLAAVRRYSAGGRKLAVAVAPGAGAAVAGELAFVDNAVDAATGTIKLRAIFPNADHRLWPGQFVNVTLVLNQEPDAVVLPAVAVQMGQDGRYVYVVRDDMTVERRAIALARVIEDEAVASEGVKAGERVVVDGQFRLVPGSRVEIKGGARAAGGAAGAPPTSAAGTP